MHAQGLFVYFLTFQSQYLGLLNDTPDVHAFTV